MRSVSHRLFSIGALRGQTLAAELKEAPDRSPGTVIVATHDRWLRARWPGETFAL